MVNLKAYYRYLVDSGFHPVWKPCPRCESRAIPEIIGADKKTRRPILKCLNCGTIYNNPEVQE